VRLFFSIPEIGRYAAGRDWYFVVDKPSGELKLQFRSKAVQETVPAAKFLIPKEEKTNNEVSSSVVPSTLQSELDFSGQQAPRANGGAEGSA
jgi:hypothetical protein